MGTETRSEVGFGGTIGWAFGGALGGAVGAAIFAAIMLVTRPTVISVAIPETYRLTESATVGFGLHVIHGVVLGLVFAFLVTRPWILGILRTDVTTPVLAGWSLTGRLVAAGFVYGLAVWAVLPMLLLPLWQTALGTTDAATFPAVAVEGLIGHLVFGVVLGALFALSVDLSDRPSVEWPEP